MFVFVLGETACTNKTDGRGEAFAWLLLGGSRAERILGAKPTDLGSAATEIKLLGNMQLRPGSLPSLSLRNFPSTKGLDFSAVGAYCIPAVTSEHTFVCTIQSECACRSTFKSGSEREGLSPSRTFVICYCSETSKFIYYQLIPSLRYLRALNW